MRWGSPTATTPFATLDFAPASMSTSRMRSSILGIYHPGGVFHSSATNNGQFDKFTDRTEGALTKPYISPSLTHPALKDIYAPSITKYLRVRVSTVLGGSAFSLLQVFLDSPLSRRMTESGTQSMGFEVIH